MSTFSSVLITSQSSSFDSSVLFQNAKKDRAAPVAHPINSVTEEPKTSPLTKSFASRVKRIEAECTVSRESSSLSVPNTDCTLPFSKPKEKSESLLSNHIEKSKAFLEEVNQDKKEEAVEVLLCGESEMTSMHQKGLPPRLSSHPPRSKKLSILLPGEDESLISASHMSCSRDLRDKPKILCLEPLLPTTATHPEGFSLPYTLGTEVAPLASCECTVVVSHQQLTAKQRETNSALPTLYATPPPTLMTDEACSTTPLNAPTSKDVTPAQELSRKMEEKTSAIPPVESGRTCWVPLEVFPFTEAAVGMPSQSQASLSSRLCKEEALVNPKKAPATESVALHGKVRLWRDGASGAPPKDYPKPLRGAADNCCAGELAQADYTYSEVPVGCLSKRCIDGEPGTDLFNELLDSSLYISPPSSKSLPFTAQDKQEKRYADELVSETKQRPSQYLRRSNPSGSCLSGWIDPLIYGESLRAHKTKSARIIDTNKMKCNQISTFPQGDYDFSLRTEENPASLTPKGNKGVLVTLRVENFCEPKQTSSHSTASITSRYPIETFLNAV